MSRHAIEGERESEKKINLTRIIVNEYEYYGIMNQAINNSAILSINVFILDIWLKEEKNHSPLFSASWSFFFSIHKMGPRIRAHASYGWCAFIINNKMWPFSYFQIRPFSLSHLLAFLSSLTVVHICWVFAHSCAHSEVHLQCIYQCGLCVRIEMPP